MAQKRAKRQRRYSSGIKAVTVDKSDVEYLNNALDKLLKEISDSFTWWVGAAYRRNESEIVGDASPQADIGKTTRKVVRGWQRRLDKISEDIASRFIDRIKTNADRKLLAAAKAAEFTIPLINTPAVQTFYKASVEEMAGLIRNLSDEYLSKAQGVVWRGVQNGRDLKSIRDDLVEQVGIEKRRAARIAMDQANKATQGLATIRAESSGIVFGIWQHNTGGSKTYRESHVDFDGEVYPLDRGLYDTAVEEYVHPAELPFCKCSFRPLIPGTYQHAEALKQYKEYA